ncbi:hypothetical protein [Limnohabitans sp.]|jgi:hypothetical protein|uniref:hypothetical protein n=1 Tax=Limnohabitans sp. TaxID=1907725 RepID=UPI0037C16D73
MANQHDQQEALLQYSQAQEALLTHLIQLQGHLTVQKQAWQKIQAILKDDLAGHSSLAQHQITVDAVQLQSENLHTLGIIALLEKRLRRDSCLAAPVSVRRPK